MEPVFTELTEDDLPAVKEIYDYYILNSTATFHTTNISLDELKESVFIHHPKYKSYLINESDKICGYCYLTQYKKRQAYDRTAEITIYLKSGYQGKGTGLKAIDYLESDAIKNGIKVLIAIICGDNTPSIRLFEKAGFEKCAHFKKVGEKFGKILDVMAFQKIIDDE